MPAPAGIEPPSSPSRGLIFTTRRAARKVVMKLNTPTKVFGVTLLAAVIFTASNAAAHTPRSRPVEATVESVNLENRTLTIAPAKGKGPSNLVLTRQTKFIHNWKFAPKSELKPGTHATVYYRTPFFGKPFVTKIVWLNQHQP